MEDLNILHFDRKCTCDFCGCKEICAITQYGTTHYNRLICVECALSINQQQRLLGVQVFDLNKSTIRFNVEDLDEDNENA